METLRRYALSFLGLPYRWGGDDPVLGFDCSGLVQELLASVGMDPPGDQTAEALREYFSVHGKASAPAMGALLFFGKPGAATHIAMAIDGWRMIEAGGGGSKTNTEADAARQNAYVRIRPIANRRDLIAVLMPSYPADRS